MPLTVKGGIVNCKLKNKWEALRRSDNYRQDWETAFYKFSERVKTQSESSGWSKNKLQFEFLSSREGRIARSKYGLQMPWHYDDPIWNPNEDDLPPVFLENYAVEVVPKAPGDFVEIGENASIFDLSPHLEAERYLTLKIDLSKPKAQINQEIDYYYEKYLSLALPGKKKKVKGNSIDEFCWKVWDMQGNEREKSAWQITKELYPEIAPKYPQDWEINVDTGKLAPEAKKARRYLRKVERALKKAQKEIDSINPTA